LRETVNRMVRHWMPGLYERLRFRFGHPAAMVQIGRLVSVDCGGKVISGPFAGMVCADAVSGSFVPKLLGSYEAELHEILEAITGRNYRQIIDIGCGEGYYAVGLAMRLTGAKVLAFDTDARARAACQVQARRNGVENRVEVCGACDVPLLREKLSPGALLVLDCEGFEADLLQPQLVPALLDCDILVELHEAFSPGVTQAVKSRFEGSHDITFINAKPRDPSTYPALRGLSEQQQRLAVDEARYGAMQWAWMQRRSIA
jgi:SAM-dependent methyltransferase